MKRFDIIRTFLKDGVVHTETETCQDFDEIRRKQEQAENSLRRSNRMLCEMHSRECVTIILANGDRIVFRYMYD